MWKTFHDDSSQRMNAGEMWWKERLSMRRKGSRTNENQQRKIATRALHILSNNLPRHHHADPCYHMNLVYFPHHLSSQAGQFVAPNETNEWLYLSHEKYDRPCYIFWYSRTRLLKASSTLIRCLADVSMNLHPKCLAKSRPLLQG